MPYLYQYSIAIPIYQGLLAIFVVVNFGLATFMDPGTYPRGKTVKYEKSLMFIMLCINSNTCVELCVHTWRHLFYNKLRGHEQFRNLFPNDFSS